MDAIKIKNNRDAVLGKIIVVAAVIKPVGVVFVVVFVIQIQINKFLICRFGNFVQFGTEHFGANKVNVIRVVFMCGVNPSHHVDIQVGHGIFQRENRVLRIIF